MDLKLYVGERLDGTEPLGDPAQRQHGRSGHVNHLLRRLTRREVVQKFGGMFRPAPRLELAGLCDARGAGGSLVRRGVPARGIQVRIPLVGKALSVAYFRPILSQAALYCEVQMSDTV
ncbi:hypothetical protein GCM10010510_28470 [Streptomyces anandii JCM 4720]|nr:hypothetical protein GCM10010510_28470 [Streptomyces anandii JCM 4720]